MKSPPKEQTRRTSEEWQDLLKEVEKKLTAILESSRKDSHD